MDSPASFAILAPDGAIEIMADVAIFLPSWLLGPEVPALAVVDLGRVWV